MTIGIDQYHYQFMVQVSLVLKHITANLANLRVNSPASLADPDITNRG